MLTLVCQVLSTGCPRRGPGILVDQGGGPDRLAWVAMRDAEQTVRAAYRAFNDRDVAGAVELMHVEVDWPNAWEGGRVVGRAAVVEYWTRQFAAISSRVEPERMRVEPDGSVTVDVRQVVRDARTGGTLSDACVRHRYGFRDGLIARMDVLEPQGAEAGAEARYDSIGGGYAGTRREDPQICLAVHAALGGARTVVNVGAGAGSYEPHDRHVIAIEPSDVMAGQRPPGLALGASRARTRPPGSRRNLGLRADAPGGRGACGGRRSQRSAGRYLGRSPRPSARALRVRRRPAARRCAPRVTAALALHDASGLASRALGEDVRLFCESAGGPLTGTHGGSAPRRSVAGVHHATPDLSPASQALVRTSRPFAASVKPGSEKPFQSDPLQISIQVEHVRTLSPLWALG